MNGKHDETTALYLSVAEPRWVWNLLDTFSVERFKRTLEAKQRLAEVDPDRLEELSSGTVFDLQERQLNRDSRRGIFPGQLITPEHLSSVPPLVKIAGLLRLIDARQQKLVLPTLEASLSERLKKLLRQRWNFSPEARRQLMDQASFEPELFTSFARRAPVGVMEWLLNKVHFGVTPIISLCELSPLLAVAASKTGLRTRRRLATATHGLPASRAQRIAILMMSLPPETSAQLFKDLGPDHVHAITIEISKLPPISQEAREQAVDEVLSMTIQELEVAVRHSASQISKHLLDYLDQA